MFKRVIWMGAGFSAGLGSSYWVKKAVNRKVNQYIPQDVRATVETKAKSATRTVAVAVNEGRAVMRQYQADAEAEIASPTRRSHLRSVQGP